MDPRGVGNRTLTSEENRAEYDKAAGVFLDLCLREGVDFAGCNVLDIGCGNGFYTRLLQQQGVRSYTGIDITDVLLKKHGLLS